MVPAPEFSHSRGQTRKSVTAPGTSAVGWIRHCQSNLGWPAKAAALRRSGRQLTPLGQRGGAVLLEDIAAIEVAVLVEVVVDRGVGGSEFLQGPYVPELRHRSFSSSERLV